MESDSVQGLTSCLLEEGELFSVIPVDPLELFSWNEVSVFWTRAKFIKYVTNMDISQRIFRRTNVRNKLRDGCTQRDR